MQGPCQTSALISPQSWRTLIAEPKIGSNGGNNMIRSETKSPFDTAYKRVADQISLVYETNPMEAYATCLAHSRVLARLVAAIADTPDDFLDGMNKLIDGLRMEATAAFLFKEKLDEHSRG
jgi:hypothetical protein